MAEEEKEKFDNYKYQQQYIKENVKFVHVPMNMKFPEEKRLFDYLTVHAKETGEKKATYIKRLIRDDIDRTRYRIKPEYLDLWGEDATEDTVLSRQEVEDIVRGWDKTVADVIDQLILATDE